MKLAIPSESDKGLQSIRSGHFGHSAYFTIVEIEDGKILNVESVKNADHDAVGCGGVIDYALSLGIDAILAAGMGRPPFMRFTESGVDVYIEQETPRVDEVVQLFIEGKVAKMSLDAACNHH